MPFVFAPEGIAIDWDWETGLTLWSAGADRVTARLATHALTERPADQREAAEQARRWWEAEGRDLVPAAAAAPTPPQ